MPAFDEIMMQEPDQIARAQLDRALLIKLASQCQRLNITTLARQLAHSAQSLGMEHCDRRNGVQSFVQHFLVF